VSGGLAEIRTRVEALQRKFNEDSKVRHAAVLQQAHYTTLHDLFIAVLHLAA
jgi:hypothetical protein